MVHKNHYRGNEKEIILPPYVYKNKINFKSNLTACYLIIF